MWIAVQLCVTYTGDPASTPEGSVTTVTLDPGDGSPLVTQPLDLSQGNRHCMSHTYSRYCFRHCRAKLLVQNHVSEVEYSDLSVRTVS